MRDRNVSPRAAGVHVHDGILRVIRYSSWQHHFVPGGSRRARGSNARQSVVQRLRPGGLPRGRGCRSKCMRVLEEFQVRSRPS
jgi:predicted methyltransferase